MKLQAFGFLIFAWLEAGQAKTVDICSQYKQDVYSCQEESLELRAANQNLMLNLTETTTRLGQLEEKVEIMEDKILTLENQREKDQLKFEKEIFGLKSLFLTVLDTKLGKVDNKFETTGKKIDKLDTRIEKYLDQIREEVQELEDDVDNLDSKLDKNFSQAKSLEQNVDLVKQSQFETFQQSVNQQLDTLNEKVIQLKPIAKKPVCVAQGVHNCV